MAKRVRAMTPPINDEALERKLVAMAMAQVEKQLEEGTASAQVLTHFLKVASQRATHEMEKLRLENQLLEEKIKAEKSGQQLQEMFDEVLRSLKTYTYNPGGDDYDTSDLY